jgi:hypothetical protein
MRTRGSYFKVWLHVGLYSRRKEKTKGYYSQAQADKVGHLFLSGVAPVDIPGLARLDESINVCVS